MDATQLEANFVSLDSQLNSEATPLAQRFRALFTLKSLGGHRAIDIIGKGEHPITLCGVRSLTRAPLPHRVRWQECAART